MLPHSGDRLQPVSSVADDACADAYVRLRERLHGPERCIADELGISGYLAVATVATRARPAGRLAVSPDQAPQFLEAAAELGLYCCIGRARLVSVPDAIPETRHAALFVADERPDAMSLVYFGVSADIAAGAEQVELYGDHRLRPLRPIDEPRFDVCIWRSKFVVSFPLFARLQTLHDAVEAAQPFSLGNRTGCAGH